jgi:hypothetical protein
LQFSGVIPPIATQGTTIKSLHHLSMSVLAEKFAILVVVGKKAPKAT